MASAANGRSGSGSGSFEIDEVVDIEYQVLNDTGEQSQREDIGSSGNGVGSSRCNSIGLMGKAMSSRIWKWLVIPFVRTKSPVLQPDLTSISITLPVAPKAIGPQPRDKNRIRRRMPAVVRNIRSCFGRAMIRSSSVLYLTDPMSAELIGFMANAAAVGIPTLSIYSATYFLAWRKENSACNFPFPPEMFAKADTMTRLVVVSLPFICLPVVFVIGGFAKIAQKYAHFLGFAAGLVLCELIYILFLGSMMMTCMSNISGTYTGVAAIIILGLLVFLWGCCCHQPKCLRYIVLSKCCCPSVDDVARGQDDQM